MFAWLDIIGEKIHWVDYSAGSDEEIAKTHKWVSTGTAVGVIGLTETPLKYVAAVREGYAEFDLTSAKGEGELVKGKLLKRIHEDGAGLRFNDGWVFPNGEFFAGSMFDFTADRSDVGKLYIYNGASNEARVVAENILIPNGVAFSPDLKLMYFVDSLNYTIWKFDFDAATGAMSNKRVFIKINFDDFPGVASPEPDGLCTSTDGSVWVSVWGSSTVRRFSSNGDLLEIYRFPAVRCSCPAFAGPDMDELVVTTANVDLKNPECKFPGPNGDLGGDIFKVKIPGVRGMPRYIFGKNNL